jgi:hypothetical protein
MKLKNHLGEIFELRIEKYHLELSEIEVKLFNSDWLDTEISISNKDGAFTTPLEFLIEDFERILDWLSGLENKTTKKYLYFLDMQFFLMRTKRNNVPFIKVIYYISEIDFVSWDLEINKENLLEFKNEIQQSLKMYPCRCGMEHNYSKV